MTFFIAMFILLMQFLWKYIDDLVGKGLEWYVIAQLLFYASSTFVPLALPLAVLLSSLMTFGNLGEKYELVALKAAGISLKQIMRPLAITAIIISIAAFYFSDYILPVANLKMRSLLFDVREQKPAVNIQEGVFYNGIDNYVIRVGSKDKDGKTLRNIMIYDHTDRIGDINLTIADHGNMEFTKDKRYLLFYLYDGVNYFEDMSSRKKEMSKPLQRTIFKQQYTRIDLSEFSLTRTSEDLFKGNYSMLNLHQLKTVTDSLTGNYINNKAGYTRKFAKDNLYYYSSLYDKGALIKNEQLPMNNEQLKNKLKKPDTISKAKTIITQQSAIGKKQLATVKVQDEVHSLPTIAKNETQISKDKSQNTITDIKSKTSELNSRTSAIKSDIIQNFEKKQRSSIIGIAIELTRRGRESLFFENEDLISKMKLINRHKIEYFRKYTLSIACIIFFLIGAPLGAIIRRGGFGLPVVISVLFFVVYHVISIIGEKFAREGVFPVYIGMCLSTIVSLPIGFILAYKGTTDSPILDAELWTRFFRALHLVKKHNQTQVSSSKHQDITE